MNQDFYGVVKVLLENCRGGVMVIGDDDQDILAWNRRQWQTKYRQACPLEASHYFSDFRDSNSPEEHTLTRNYRSAVEIVSRSSGMIKKAEGELGLTRMKAGTELQPERTDGGYVEIPFNTDSCLGLLAQALERGERVALLCRSNRECRQNYDLLVKGNGIPSDSVELLGSEDFPLYQMRHSGALLDICKQRNDYDFVEPYIWEEFIGEFADRGLADSQAGQRYLELLYELVKSEAGRPRVRDLQSFVEEMHSSDVERLKPKIQPRENQGRLTIATVHKVKGLEFDTVLIMPSTESFPFSRGSGQRPVPSAADVAEEARLYYVAMTRARTRLYGGWGDRERAWWRSDEHSAEQDANGFRLEGSPSECFVSWPGQRDQVDDGIQAYIERQVCLGDPLDLKDRCLRHDGHTVGLLSRSAAASLVHEGASCQLRVSNVIRYTCGSYFREHNPGFWDRLDDEVKRQGWFYLVLAEQA
jgi:hypothetical protein